MPIALNTNDLMTGWFTALLGTSVRSLPITRSHYGEKSIYFPMLT